MILDIPVQLTVELGRTRIPIKHILQLAQGSVVELDALAGEPMDVLVNGFLIAQGEVVVVNDKFGIRLTDIVTPSERMRRLWAGRQRRWLVLGVTASRASPRCTDGAAGRSPPEPVHTPGGLPFAPTAAAAAVAGPTDGPDVR
jgi:flagellar motor switch protein FliN